MRALALQVALFVGYVAAAKLGLAFASINPSATAIWPPTGVALAALLLWGPRVWPAVFAGAFVANILTAGSVATSLVIAGGNTLEAVVGAMLVRRYAGGRYAFHQVGSFLRFAVAAMIAPLVSATMGVSVLSLAGYARWIEYGPIWLTWWLGNVSGILLVTPLLVLWSEPSPGRWSFEHYVEAALLFTGLTCSAYLVFDEQIFGMKNLPIEFFTLPFLIWTAFRFGPRETATAIVLLSAIATWGTHRGIGPFGVLGATGALVLQASTVTAAITAMCTALVVVDRRRSEDERVRALAAEQAARKEAEAANAAKDRFMAMLGHELRNPLAAIVTGVHMMERDPRHSRAGDIVRRQVTHLTRLVDDLMDVGRITADKLTLNRSPVNLAEVAASAVATMRASDQQPPVSVHIMCDPVWVDGDATRLNQIVINLLSNSFKFTPPGGTIRITTGLDAGSARLVVADDGVGIDGALLPRVFDLFKQGDPSTDHLHHGLGIGLTLVKSLVELHGGTVSARSEGPDRGSTFTVRLPAIPPPGAAAFAPAEPEPIRTSGARRRVVIAEDEGDLRRVLRAALEAAGHEVFEAASGPGAVDAVERFRPDAAVVDIGLPQFDGYEVARQVRRLPAGEGLFLVALTGYGHPNGRNRAFEAGFNLHLLKPIDPARLSELLVTEGRG